MKSLADVLVAICGALIVVVAACSAPTADDAGGLPTTAPRASTPVVTAPTVPVVTAPPATTTTPSATAAPTSAPPSTSTSTSAPEAPPSSTESLHARPEWLGTRLLPLRPDDHGEVQPTPVELIDREFETLDLLPMPIGDAYEWSIQPVPAAVLDRSSWRPDCPVTVDELRYVTMSHWGFDGEHHTGEMIVNAEWAEQVVGVFDRLHEIRFPIEQMRVIRADEIDAHPTGDWNDTTSFVCRPAVGSGSWSNHAFGLAIDINPFHNPYEKGDLVLPELASAYLDRERAAPGMILDDDAVVGAFAGIGWRWGGYWTSLLDYMHFSANGR